MSLEEEEMTTSAVEKALRCLGRGFDVSNDFRLKYCKGRERLVMVEKEEEELVVPGFGAFKNVSVDIKCDKGERIRYKSGVVEFNQMSELFNQRSSLSGKIPSGLFNSTFDFDGSSWAQDASKTKCLAMDGYFISLFNLRLDCKPLTLSSRVINAVPSTWDPAAIARFIENYGTHIVVGLSMGGQDAIYVKQDKSSLLSSSEIKEHLDKLGHQVFTGTCTLPLLPLKSKDHRFKVPEAFINVFDTQTRLDGLSPMSCKEGITVICSKRGGNTSGSCHSEWLHTVPAMPDVINFTFVPITSLLKGVPGIGFLSHAINLYLRYKPPITELKYFLDFQYHKVWAPMHNDLPLGPSSNRSGSTPSLYFNPMSSKLYVSTSQVIAKRWPVTGMRLHLEGKKNNRLAIHLQHLLNSPKFMGAQPDKSPPLWQGSDVLADDRYYEPVHWKMFANVCTAPVKYDPRWSAADGGTAFIVTGAQLHVKAHESTNVLHLRLQFSEVPGCIVAQSKWARGLSGFSEKLGFMSMPYTGSSSALERGKQPGLINVDSGVFAAGPPVPVGTQKLLKFVDTSHITMGPQDSPGYWLVTGAKLDVEKGRVMLHVKFSLLTSVS